MTMYILCLYILEDFTGSLINLYEKIKNPPGNIANGALYAFEPALLNYLNCMSSLPTDFSTEVIPSLIGRIQTYHTKHSYLDIGTPEALAIAQQFHSCLS